MKKPTTIFIIVFLLTAMLSGCRETIDKYDSVNSCPEIYPDYNDVTLPPNIAPCNFLVKETGQKFFVKIYSDNAKPIEIFSSTGKIKIPPKPWHQLLDSNRGGGLYFDIFVKNAKGTWQLFSTITNRIAAEDIDSHIVYRKIHPVHSRWSRMGIYQRDLASYKESTILDNWYFKEGCVNCHSFRSNRADVMSLGIRSEDYGFNVLIADKGRVGKINTKFGYTTWHPSGKVAVYSINKVNQFFHLTTDEVRDVIDLDSTLAYYLTDSKTVKTDPAIARKDRLETYPCFSSDGKYLYFCSAALLWPADEKKIPPKNYKQCKYDLVRAEYDLKNDKWSESQTILSAQDTQLSILEPRVSPDGRWLLFCMCRYGCFPVYQPSSDLYLMDLAFAEKTGEFRYRRLDINSDQSESWHSWSSNSRWIAFSSKRDSCPFTRTYFSYVDQAGKVYKPFILPQRDPVFYDFCLYTYSVPELIDESVNIHPDVFGRAVRSSYSDKANITITSATPGAEEEKSPWTTRE